MSCNSDEPSTILESMDHAVLDSPQIATKTSKKRQRSSKSVEKKESDELRKTMHRDIEKQRRQEMSTLYASLRDLLPLEYIKGKRSVSDHMHEATNYIKDMEKNMEELKLQRDRLKNNASTSNSFNNLPNFVTVNCGCEGVEILINCGYNEGYGICLSRVIIELTRNGLDIVSCISNKVNGRFLYKIHTEVNALAYINLAELQQRLANEIN